LTLKYHGFIQIESILNKPPAVRVVVDSTMKVKYVKS